MEEIKLRGYVRLYDTVSKSPDAFALFGRSRAKKNPEYGAWPWENPIGESKKIWCIPFSENENWKQTLIDGGRIIIREKPKKRAKPEKETSEAETKNDGVLQGMVHVVFGRTKNKKKKDEYEYLGEFKIVAKGDFGDFQVLKRIATRTDLPPPKTD